MEHQFILIRLSCIHQSATMQPGWRSPSASGLPWEQPGAEVGDMAADGAVTTTLLSTETIPSSTTATATTRLTAATGTRLTAATVVMETATGNTIHNIVEEPPTPTVRRRTSMVELLAETR